VRGGGDRLGPVGGRIVTEVLIGLLRADPASYLSLEPDWRPTLPAAGQGRPDGPAYRVTRQPPGGTRQRRNP
jgi:hypothetical protein